MVEVSDADRIADTSTFLTDLFGDVPPEKWALLWTLQNKTSTWVPLSGGTEDVALTARSLGDEGMDVYVAVSVADEPGKGWSRISSENSRGLMGLWADIDIADPDVHKKWNLPPDEKAALELIEECKMEPTLIVHSGHGLQAWWLFHEFWEFDNADERLVAAQLAQSWNTTLRVRAAERSWTIDSTFDLARVMRVPGTLNRKGSPVVPVKLMLSGGPRWNPSDFDEHLIGEDHPALRGISPTRAYQPGALELTEGVQPPFEKFQALMANSEQFEKTWNQQRKDFSDQSPSVYDLSLATLAKKASWTDQEICQLVFAWRRHHGHDTSKALRQDYMRRTIQRAHDACARERASDALDEIDDLMDEAKQSGDPEAVRDVRRVARDYLSQQLVLEVSQMFKTVSDPNHFGVVTPVKTVWFDGIEGVTNWYRFMNKVLAKLDHQIPRFKPAEWDRITNAMSKVWEELEIGDEATDIGETSAWLVQYLSQRPPVATLEEAAASEYPFITDHSDTAIFLHGFKRWLFTQHRENIGKVLLGRRLRDLGCRPDKVNVVVDGVRTSRAIWLLPMDLK